MAGFPDLPYPDLINAIRSIFPTDQKLYLVGGAIRDMLIDRPTHDLDFVTWGHVRRLARKVADYVGGAFFMLDDVRETARIICPDNEKMPKIIDIAMVRSDTIEDDLRLRDFTINAMAVDLHMPSGLIDPLGGSGDLKKGELHTCSATSFVEDPLRILRSIRLANELNLRLDEDIFQLMNQALPGLKNVSAERSRDELFKILDGDHIKEGIRRLDRIGVVGVILPELEMVKSSTHNNIHCQDRWQHTLAAIHNLENLVAALLGKSVVGDSASRELMGLADNIFNRFSQHIDKYLKSCLAGDRTRKSLLFLACLYIDYAKLRLDEVKTFTNGKLDNVKTRGTDIIRSRARELALSVPEIEHLENLMVNHSDVHRISEISASPDRRDIYHYFRRSGEAGVGICLLSMADLLATFGIRLPRERLVAEMSVCQKLFQAWWEEPFKTINPPRLLNGDDLQRQFGLSPGPQVGELLEAIREAQASGEVMGRGEAITFAGEWLENNFNRLNRGSNSEAA
jgi:hypothetical protein